MNVQFEQVHCVSRITDHTLIECLMGILDSERCFCWVLPTVHLQTGEQTSFVHNKVDYNCAVHSFVCCAQNLMKVDKGHG